MMEDVDKTNKELMETEAKLRESIRELRMMDKKKDEFISIAAHELKTPLTAIHGFSQLLADPRTEKDKTKRRNYLKIIDKETRRLSSLVTEILELSRIDLGTIRLKEEVVDLNNIINTVKSEMAVNAKEKGLRLEWNVKGLPVVRTDREKLTQILLNMMNNAIKYTERGSISLDAWAEKDRVHFVIKDTGIGIAKEEQKKIFDRFYQVDSSYTREAGGTGLGLALCSEYLKLLGGKIWVESEPGKGSTFHFTIPLGGIPKEVKGREKRKIRERVKELEEIKKKLKGMRVG